MGLRVVRLHRENGNEFNVQGEDQLRVPEENRFRVRGCRIYGAGFGVFDFWVLGLGFSVQGLGRKVGHPEDGGGDRRGDLLDQPRLLRERLRVKGLRFRNKG